MADFFWCSDEQWAKIEPLLPTGLRGKRRVDDRRVLSEIVHALKCGGRWTNGRMSMGRARRSTTGLCAGRNAASGRTSSRRSPGSKAFRTGCLSTVAASRCTGARAAQKGGLGQWYRQDFDKRVKITNECIKALKTIWAEPEPEFHGEYISFPQVISNPKPKQNPHPPIIIGSGDGKIDNSRIIRRVAEIADGWISLALTPAQAKAQLAELRAQCEERQRDFSKMDIGIINPAQILDPEHATMPVDHLVAEYEAAGVGRLNFAIGRLASESDFKRRLEWVARATGLVRG